MKQPYVMAAALRTAAVVPTAPIQRATPAEMLQRLAASGAPRPSHGARCRMPHT